MIQLEGLTKSYGPVHALVELTATVADGRVTGLAGPNGAGKSTAMKMMVGLTRPSAGRALVNGVDYRELRTPMTAVGLALETRACHPGRRIRSHLAYLAAATGLPGRRVDDVLELVGLSGVATRRAKTMSLGMAQRLALAAALLGDPGVLILDEPMNGLDPSGMVWLRQLLRRFADEGRTVLVSSHLMTELSLLADHMLVVSRGRLMADAGLDELRLRYGMRLRVRCSEPDRLAAVLAQHAAVVQVDRALLEARGISSEELIDAAAGAGISIEEVVEVPGSLEDAFLALTADDKERAA